MKITEGTKLGHYEIRGKIGSGGMGEVYLAEDTKLDRKVALKVLPAEVAQNTDRMQRFIREAKAASSLNHPNIAHIYEIGEADGVSYLAMELVDGVTLREKIHGEKTDLRTLLKYLAQVADGLAKAHASGIVHRDLKPDNIMISSDGFAKILDFGLAKLVESGQTTNNEDATAMMQPQLSVPGMIMGTAGYMSPEQSKGKAEIDQRSDIFSFGCVLFEAATRQQPFTADSVIDTLHKIINAPAPLLRDLRPDSPPDLQRVVRRCLAKDPEDRYQTIKDVAIELKELRRDMKTEAELHYSSMPSPQVNTVSNENATAIISVDESANRPAATNELSQLRSTSSAEYLLSGIRQNRRGVLIALAVLVLAGAGVAFGLYRYLWQVKNSGTPFEKAKLTKLTRGGKVISTAISPDGKYIAHIESDGGQQSLLVRQTNANNDITVVSPAKVEYWGITFSRDSNDLFYVNRETNQASTLYRIPAIGGLPVRISERIDCPVTFSPDGKQMAFVRGDFPEKDQSALMIANSDGSGEQILSSRKAPDRFYPIYFTGPSWSPDGKTIASVVLNAAGAFDSQVIGVNVSDGKERLLSNQKWGYLGRVEWLADNSGLMMVAREQTGSYRQIWFLSTVTGEIRQVINDFLDYRNLSMTADSRKLVTAQLDRASGVWVAATSAIDQARQITTATSEGLMGAAWVLDSKLIFFRDVGGENDLSMMNADGSRQRPLTSFVGNANSGSRNSWPAVSRDGGRVVFCSTRGGSYAIWVMGIDGNNQKQLTNRIGDDDPTFSADGKWIIFASYNAATKGLWKVSVDGGEPVSLTDGNYSLPAASPDGTMIAAMYLENPAAPDQRADKMAVVPIDGGTPIKVFSIQNSATAFSMVKWLADSKSLIFSQFRDNISNLWVQPLAGGEQKQLTNFKESYIYTFAFSPDGKNIVLSRGNYTRDAILLSTSK